MEGRIMFLDKIAYKLGYIKKEEFITAALRTYALNDVSADNEKQLYYNMGNANAINHISKQLGINIIDSIKEMRRINNV